MWNVIKKADPGEVKPNYVDQFGIGNGGKNLVIKLAENKADKPINGKKASLAELLMAAYKYNSRQKYDPKQLEFIRIQDIQQKETAQTMSEVEKAMNPKLEKSTKETGLNVDSNPESRPENMSVAAWRLKVNQKRRKHQQDLAKKDRSRPRPARINTFDLSDESNQNLYQKMKNSVWGESVERICHKFGKRIVRIHVNMAEAQSYLIFYLA